MLWSCCSRDEVASISCPRIRHDVPTSSRLSLVKLLARLTTLPCCSAKSIANRITKQWFLSPMLQTVWSLQKSIFILSGRWFQQPVQSGLRINITSLKKSMGSHYCSLQLQPQFAPPAGKLYTPWIHTLLALYSPEYAHSQYPPPRLRFSSSCFQKKSK